MSFGDIMTTEYWGVPLWGWILIIVVLALIVVGVRSAIAKKNDAATAKKGDLESGTMTEAEGAVAIKSDSPVEQNFPRDAPLPPPAPSETSNK